MRITEVTVSLGALINIGNFENRKVDVSMTAQVEEDESPDSVRGFLIDHIKQVVQTHIDEIKPPRSPYVPQRLAQPAKPQPAADDETPF